MIGKWRITEMELWDSDFIDLLGPGYIQFDPEGGDLYPIQAAHLVTLTAACSLSGAGMGPTTLSAAEQEDE